MRFDAATLARGWLSVALATSKEQDRPVLYKTVHIEAYPEGIRLIATDGYMLLTAWVPDADHTDGPEPALDDSPYATAVAFDEHGRGADLLRHLLALATAKDAEPFDVRLQLGIIERDEDHGALAFEGLEARYVVIDHPDSERVKLRTIEAEYPAWRTMVAAFEAKQTTGVALNPELIGRLAKLGKLLPGVLVWHFGGAEAAASISMPEAWPLVLTGLVMPCKWDFASNAPEADSRQGSEAA